MTTINTQDQDATECILCGRDTSETMGYCENCEKAAKIPKGKKK